MADGEDEADVDEDDVVVFLVVLQPQMVQVGMSYVHEVGMEVYHGVWTHFYVYVYEMKMIDLRYFNNKCKIDILFLNRNINLNRGSV